MCQFTAYLAVVFHPFLRFYRVEEGEVETFSPYAFQPFLRFYVAIGSDNTPPSPTDTFQPFLKFYGM